MNQFYLNAPQQPEVKFMDSLLAELFLEETLRQVRKEQIMKEIDCSLRDGNKEEFMKLTNELKTLSS